MENVKETSPLLPKKNNKKISQSKILLEPLYTEGNKGLM